MRTPSRSPRYLPDGTPLRNHMLAALPDIDYARVLTHLRLKSVVTGDTLQETARASPRCTFRTAGVLGDQ